jgi:membrane protein required for beta-lactamase induction
MTTERLSRANVSLKRAWAAALRVLALLVVFAIAALPLIVGLVAGVVYGVARIVWAALVEGFTAGRGLVRR